MLFCSEESNTKRKNHSNAKAGKASSIDLGICCMRLNGLRTSDLRRLSDFVAGVLRCSNLNDLELFVHGNVRGLVDGDVTAWNEVTLNGEVRYVSTWPMFGERFWDKIAPVIAGNLKVHPMIRDLNRSLPKVCARRLSDCETYGSYLKSILYNEGYRHWDCRAICYSLIATGRDSYLGFQVNRSNGDFSDVDFQLFQAPDLQQHGL